MDIRIRITFKIIISLFNGVKLFLYKNLSKIFIKYPLVRYLFVGGLNTVISILLYNILLFFKMNYLLATAITNVFGVIEGFLLNSYIVFGQKPKFSTLFKYSTIYAISFVLNLIIMNILVGFMGVSKYLALYPAIVLVTIINYFLIKKFLFKSN